MSRAQTRNVAIACQGGGSHTAFTAGVLTVLLAAENAKRFKLAALSGTSGGAMCATLAWSALISSAADKSAEVERRLTGFWNDLKADSPFDAARNFWGLFAARLPIMAEISPYTYAPFAEEELRRNLRLHADFANLPPKGSPERTKPYLFVGVTEILEGVTDKNSVFCGETITIKKVIASAAIPPVFRAIQVGKGRYWDGLFSHNPPVRILTDLPAAERPNEIWVIRINPRRRKKEPRTVPEIIDRRNELSGNLALDQECVFIARINDLIARAPGLSDYKHIEVREIALDAEPFERRGIALDYASKLDRSPDFIDDLMAAGRQAAWTFLKEQFRGVTPPS